MARYRGLTRRYRVTVLPTFNLSSHGVALGTFPTGPKKVSETTVSFVLGMAFDGANIWVPNEEDDFVAKVPAIP